MACDVLTGGRNKPCKDAVGGIRKIHFADFGAMGTVTMDATLAYSDNISDMSGNVSNELEYHTYDVKGNSSLETNIQTSIENGTTFFEQTLNITLHKLTGADNKEIKLLAFARPHVFVETFDGKVFCVGREHGAECTGGTAVTGTAMGDLQGYTLTFVANEVTLPNELNGATSADPFAGMSTLTASASTARTP